MKKKSGKWNKTQNGKNGKDGKYVDTDFLVVIAVCCFIKRGETAGVGRTLAGIYHRTGL